MAYAIQRTYNNGYRCCCHSTHTSDPEWASSRETALAAVPRELEDDDYGELEEIEIRDGATGDLIAWGKLEWTGGRGTNYRCDRWYGQIDGESFESIRGNEPGESWSAMVERLRRERDLAAAEEAERKAALRARVK